MVLTLELAEKIKKIWKEEGQSRGLFVLDGIPEKRIRGARKKYAKKMGDDEKTILLYDRTVMESGKEGYLLTDKRFYHKAIVGKSSVIDIADIIDISVTATEKNKDGRYTAEQIEMKADSGSIIFAEGSPQELIKHEHIPLFYILKRTIALLQNPAAVSTVQVITCKNCGAHGSGKHCEYCGTPFN